jgi:hypothetical protein
MQTLGSVMKTVFLSNPITLPLIAITTLIGLVATNTFGLRDAFFDLGKGIHEFLEVYFKPLADGMKWFYESVLVPIGDLMGGSATQSAYAYSDSLGALNTTTLETANSSIKYADYIAELEAKLKTATVASVALDSELDTHGRKLQQTTGYVIELANATAGLTDAQLELGRATSQSVTSEKGEFRATGELAQAREKYGDVPLIKVGGNWRPTELVDSQRDFERESNLLSRMRDNFSRNGLSRQNLERLNEQRAVVDLARERYETAKANVKVIVQNNRDGSTDITVENGDETHHERRSRYQSTHGL